MTDKEAAAEKIGGEVLCYVINWRIEYVKNRKITN